MILHWILNLWQYFHGHPVSISDPLCLPSFLLPPPPPSFSLLISVSRVPSFLQLPGSLFWVALSAPPPPHTQTQSMHFRQGANGKINYQQAKALALHFCWRERVSKGEREKERDMKGVLVKKWKERRVKKRKEKNEIQRWMSEETVRDNCRKKRKDEEN